MDQVYIDSYVLSTENKTVALDIHTFLLDIYIPKIYQRKIEDNFTDQSCLGLIIMMMLHRCLNKNSNSVCIPDLAEKYS